MFKKRLLILSMLMVLTTLIYHARSYTVAKVENPANISITTSENALIAVPKNLKLAVDMHTSEDITMELTDSGEKEAERLVEISYVAADNNLQIKNNMNEVINVVVKMDGHYEGINIINDSCTLAPGRAIDKINIRVDTDIQEIPDSIDIKVYADWQGGSAVIDNEIYLSVNTIEPVIKVNTIDLRTPVLEVLLLGVEEEVLDENTDNLESENDFNREANKVDAVEMLNDIDDSMSEDNPAKVNDKNINENLNNDLNSEQSAAE